LNIEEKEEQLYLNTSSFDELLESYLSSNQTSERTKAKALELLKGVDVDKKEVELLQNDLTRKTNNPRRKKQSSERTVYLRYIQLVYNSIRTIFDESVHLLTSHRFKFLALFIAIGVQIHHSATLFYRTAPEGSSYTWTAYGYAIMADFFIIIIALEGKKSIVKVFAVLTFLTNLLYFRIWIDFDSTLEAYTNAVASLIIASTISYTIYAYTEIFVQVKLLYCTYFVKSTI